MRATGRNEFAYVPYYIPGSQESTGKILKHRLVAQQMLRRPLTKNECVIRKDGDRTNNEESNIMVFASKASARRWYSDAKNEFLFKREDGVYDYDWKKIKAMKVTTTRQEQHRKADEIRAWVKEHFDIATSDVIAKTFNLNPKTIHSYLNSHEIKYLKHSATTDNALLTWPRNDVIELVESYDNNDDLYSFLHMSSARIITSLSRRGISLREGHKKFKHISKELLEEAVAKKVKIRDMCKVFDTFEENILSELKKNDITLPRLSAFAFSENYIMPSDNDYSNEVVVPNYTQVENDNFVQQEVKQTKAVRNDCSISIKEFCETHNLKLCDISFIFGKSLHDFVNSGSSYTEEDIDEYLRTAKSISKTRTILTPDNVLAMIEAGHNNDEIAHFYNIPSHIVEHVVNHI